MMFTQPNFTSTTSLDFAETSPATMVRAGNFTDSDRPNDSHVAFSTDGGANWFQGSEPGGVNSGGTVAAAANGSRFVWSPGDAGTTGRLLGRLRQLVDAGFRRTGEQHHRVDRVNSMKFYAFNAGRFYVSTNGGAAFTQTAATGLPTTSVHFKARPGAEGDIWLAGDTGLFHSTNSGASFTKAASVTEAVNVAYGKAAPGQSVPRAVPRRHHRRGQGRVPVRQRRLDLGPDQRRRPPVRQHGRGADRRPANLRPGLPRHQRPRHLYADRTGARRRRTPPTTPTDQLPEPDREPDPEPAADAHPTPTPTNTPDPDPDRDRHRRLLGDVQHHQPVGHRLPGRGGGDQHRPRHDLLDGDLVGSVAVR
jgi:hypothetical protein